MKHLETYRGRKIDLGVLWNQYAIALRRHGIDAPERPTAANPIKTRITDTNELKARYDKLIEQGKNPADDEEIVAHVITRTMMEHYEHVASLEAATSHLMHEQVQKHAAETAPKLTKNFTKAIKNIREALSKYPDAPPPFQLAGEPTNLVRTISAVHADFITVEDFLASWRDILTAKEGALGQPERKHWAIMNLTPEAITANDVPRYVNDHTATKSEWLWEQLKKPGVEFTLANNLKEIHERAEAYEQTRINKISQQQTTKRSNTNSENNMKIVSAFDLL